MAAALHRQNIGRTAEFGREESGDIDAGFSVDCLETLEEIAMEGEEQFMDAGGEKYGYIPCLNATDPGIDVIESVVRRELQGWI